METNKSMVIQVKLLDEIKKKAKRDKVESISLSSVSRETGISISALSLMARSKTSGIKISTLEKLCTYLDCEPGDLLVMVEDKNG